MKIDTRPRHKNSGKSDKEKRCAPYLQWLRGRVCFIDNHECEGRIEAAHTYGSGSKGMGTKAKDSYAIPLCSKHHREQHDMGWMTFQQRYSGFVAPDIAEVYWRYWPGRAAWEKKNGG